MKTEKQNWTGLTCVREDEDFFYHFNEDFMIFKIKKILEIMGKTGLAEKDIKIKYIQAIDNFRENKHVITITVNNITNYYSLQYKGYAGKFSFIVEDFNGGK